MGAASTERLWLTEPVRKTSIAEVVEVRGDRFRLDRSLYCPKSRAYRHPQRPDRGVVWLPNGEKRKLRTVFERDGALWHRLRDAVPNTGDRLQCHLDVPRREETARTHTALHLLVSAVVADRGPALAKDPEVQGGGTARVTFASPYIKPDTLAGWVQQVRRWTRADLPVHREPVTRDVAVHRLTAQPFDPPEPYPGPETTLESVFVDKVGGLPCDGTHAARTGDLGEFSFRHAHPTKAGGFLVVLHVAPPS